MAKRKLNVKAAKKLSNARTLLLMEFPFFGFLALHLAYYESKSAGGQSTCCVTPDGKLFYNPEFINSLSLKETMQILCHELLHIVQACHSRFPEGGNFVLWNIASDYVVNSIITDIEVLGDSPIMEKVFPDGELREYVRGKATEQIYLDLMKKEVPDDGEGEGCGCPTNVEGDDPGPDTQGKGRDPRNKLGCPSGAMQENEMTGRQKREWRKRTASAAAEAAEKKSNGRGDLPGYIQEFLARISKPTITWRDHVRRASSAVFKGRYTLARPSRRSNAIGQRLHSRNPAPKGAVVVMDTSGSVTDKMLAQFLSECAGILRTCGAPWIHVYFHDMICYADEHLNIRTISKVKVQRGGTSHIPVFEKIAEDKEDVGLIVCFTDLETSFPPQPRCPVLWAVPTGYMGHSVPWGKKIEVKMSSMFEE